MFGSNGLGQFAALALIGDGILAITNPEKDLAAWQIGPIPLRMLRQRLHGRPGLTRALGAAQIAGGVWLILQNRKTTERKTPRVA